MYMP